MENRRGSLMAFAAFTLACLAGIGDPGGAEAGSPPGPGGSTPVVAASTLESRFGVNAAAGRGPDTLGYLGDLGAGWIRLNSHLDGSDPDFASFLAAGLSLIITFNNADPLNVETTYGTPAQWPNAGFPFASRLAYQQRIRDALAPVLPYLAAGRRVVVQCENEVSDAAVNPHSRYWRGTTDQYLQQLQAFSEVVQAIHAAIPVVLSSFASEALDAVLDPSDPRSGYVSTFLSTLLTQGQYDAADLHFYGCVEDIPAKARWVRGRMPLDKVWISTENSGPDSRCPTTPLSWTQNLTLFEEIEAQQVPARLNACADNGGIVCLWFSLFDLANEPDDVFNHLGLLDPRETPPRKKPAYNAFQTFAAPLRLGLSRTSFHGGDTLILQATVTPGLTTMTADVYVGVQLPDGSILFLQGDGNLSGAMQPLARAWTISPFAGSIFAYTFGGGEPTGSYSWLAAFTEPGTVNVIGAVASARFTFSP